MISLRLYLPFCLKVTAFVLTMACTCFLSAQEIDISKEVSIRGDFAYEVLPKINDNIFLWRDRGNDQEVEVFDQNLVYKRTAKVSFENRRVIIEGLTYTDTTFSVYYSFKEDGVYYIKSKTFDDTVTPVDTVTILETNVRPVTNGFRLESSEDQSKLLIHGMNGRSLFTLIYDVTDKKVLWNKLSLIEDINVISDFLDIQISNTGKILVFFEQGDSRYDRDKHIFFCYTSTAEDTFKKHIIVAKDVSTSSLNITIDNDKQHLKLVAMAGTDKLSEINGLFYLNIPYSDMPPIIDPVFTYFDKDLIKDVYGKKQKKKKYLRNFDIVQVVNRADGGLICIAEMNREFGRRASYGGNPSFAGSAGYARQYVDYYTEDMIVFSVNPLGVIEWREVLYKKQFSQDDNNIFSSFFLMCTPSRMHLIFNDEISVNNTVSEYVLDPLGNFERNSLISTEYQNLKLRFKDAIQIGSNEFIVPSEKGQKLSLVRVNL